MVRESFIKFNLNRLKKYNKQIENRHIHNLKKVNELKKAYMNKAIEIKNVNEDIILKKDKIISDLKFQIEFLKNENKKLTSNLGEIPGDVVRKYN